MKIFYHDHFVLPLPEGHRFPMSKYALLRRRVVEASLTTPDAMRVPRAATDDAIRRAHTAAYLRKVKDGSLTPREVRRIGFPWSLQLVERSRRSVGSTIAAANAALREGVAVNLAGGTHHAGPNWGQGFCVFNDAAIAARALQADGSVRRVAILDCDVHQGNGTAAIAAGDDTIFTFSIHGAHNFPFHKERSDLDIPLEDGTGDDDYLAALDRGLRQTITRAGADLAIYLAGADPYKDDRLGRLALTKEGLAERDRLVLERCRAAGLPVAITMAGGYARHVADTVDVHFQTVALASSVAEQRRRPNGVA
ncbi:MAG: histone deacetylase [Candidatus Promineifilaceae bacterium]|nr:histone deacetylase [Candidatus Promineifilaceae bacterium]